MKRAIIALFLALMMAGLAASSHAQYLEDDRDEARPYSDDDSQILKGVGYLFSPIGVAIEWTVARPLYYLSTKSPLAPIIGAARDDEGYGYQGGPIVEAPHSQYSQIAPIAPFTAPAAGQPAAPPTTAGDAARQRAGPQPSAPGSSQPVLH
jgi:hypothetical protein